MYIIGDVQGCATELEGLLNQLDHQEDIWFCGDLVNRGPESLKVLQIIRELGSRARVVLGNHDIHLIAVALGARTLGKSDTLDQILALPKPMRTDYIDWLRHQPLAFYDQQLLMTHAGVLPQWNLALTLALSQEIEAFLQSDQLDQKLPSLFGNTPNLWHSGLQGIERLRVITNGLTRLRLVNQDGALDFKFKGDLDDLPDYLMPWFRHPLRQTKGDAIVFGHCRRLDFTTKITPYVWTRVVYGVEH